MKSESMDKSFWPIATLGQQLCCTGFGLGQKVTRGAFGQAVGTTL